MPNLWLPRSFRVALNSSFATLRAFTNGGFQQIRFRQAVLHEYVRSRLPTMIQQTDVANQHTNSSRANHGQDSRRTSPKRRFEAIGGFVFAEERPTKRRSPSPESDDSQISTSSSRKRANNDTIDHAIDDYRPRKKRSPSPATAANEERKVRSESQAVDGAYIKPHDGDNAQDLSGHKYKPFPAITYAIALDMSNVRPVTLDEVNKQREARKQKAKEEAMEYQRQIKLKQELEKQNAARLKEERQKWEEELKAKEKERVREKKKRLGEQRKKLDRENSEKQLAKALAEYRVMEKELVERVAGLGRDLSDFQISEKVASPEISAKTRRDRLISDGLSVEETQQDESSLPSPLKSKDVKLRFIAPLSEAWDQKVTTALEVKNEGSYLAKSIDGVDLSRKDLGRLLPRGELIPGSEPWLNDEVINAWYANLCARLNEKAGYVKGPNNVPRYAAYNTGWYKSATTSGIQSIGTWSRRKGIKGDKLLRTQQIFFPVNTGAHWTLLTISGVNRTIEYYDSLNSNGYQNQRKIDLAREWLKLELGAKYNEDEWNVLPRKSSLQNNSNDCGVFACLNGWALCKGSLDPSNEFHAGDIPLARRMFVATLLNGGFTGPFDI